MTMTPHDQDCDCEFDPDPEDPTEATVEDAWHYRRTCSHCSNVWFALHCVHDGNQWPCGECGKISTT